MRTDSDRRDRTIHNKILDAGPYEVITFTPVAINGLPGTAGFGDEISFSVEGDLSIRDITQRTTFDVTATVVSETELQGTAAATISREAFDLRIPSVPLVANVEEEVEVYIDFVARTG